MKIAVTSKEKSINSLIDQRFGRCNCFAIYSTDTDEYSFLDNPAKDNESGAGPAAVAFVAKQGVIKIVSGEFGIKIKGMLDSLKIEMISVKEEKTIKEIIEMIINV